MSFTRLTTSPDGVGDKLAAASGRVTSVGFFVCGKKAWRLAYSLVWERRRVCVCRQRAAQGGVALESLPGDQRRAVRLRGLPMQLSQMKADFFKRPVILQLRQKEPSLLLGVTQENPIYLEIHNFVPCIDSCVVLILQDLEFTQTENLLFPQTVICGCNLNHKAPRSSIRSIFWTECPVFWILKH